MTAASELHILREQRANDQRVLAEAAQMDNPIAIIRDVLTALMLTRDVKTDMADPFVTIERADLNLLIDRINDVREYLELIDEINGKPNRFVLRVHSMDRRLSAIEQRDREIIDMLDDLKRRVAKLHGAVR
jgi:hypothetical protein